MTHPRALLRSLFQAAIDSAKPELLIGRHLPEPPRGRTVVIGAGKASAEMARVLESHWPGHLSGLVVTRYGHRAPTRRIEIVEAAHPVPDEAGVAAARRMLSLVSELTADDLVICLMSGGGSALLALPGEGLTLADKRAINATLLGSGAPIDEMNCVRRHVSAIKGGRLGAACHPARLVTLAISDVPGDDPINIASGPTVPDPTTCADALAIVERYGMKLPDAARRLLTSGRGESVKPGDPRYRDLDFRLIATPQMALEAAAARGREAGYATYNLGDAIEGEAREVGKVLGAVALQVARHGQPFRPPCILLSGGETTVTLPPSGAVGRGGRNVEFLLSLGKVLGRHPKIHALAGDTDGVDGAADNAGAYLGPDTVERAAAEGLRLADALAAHDGHGFFEAIGDAIVTGPTLTNVNDFRAILIEG